MKTLCRTVACLVISLFCVGCANTANWQPKQQQRDKSILVTMAPDGTFTIESIAYKTDGSAHTNTFQEIKTTDPDYQKWVKYCDMKPGEYKRFEKWPKFHVDKFSNKRPANKNSKPDGSR